MNLGSDLGLAVQGLEVRVVYMHMWNYMEMKIAHKRKLGNEGSCRDYVATNELPISL